MMKTSSRQTGFTIIELMMATIIFSMVLVVVVAGFMQIGRIFYKGISISSTQEAARSLSAGITDDLTFARSVSLSDAASGAAYNDNGTSFFCVGNHRYAYKVDGYKITSADVTDSSRPIEGVQRTNIPGGCPAPSDNPGTAWKQMLGPDMQLNVLNLKCAYGTFCSLSVHIVFYGNDKTVFDTNSGGFDNDPSSPGYNANQAPDAFCSGNLLSTQFCSTADIDTSVNYQG